MDARALTIVLPAYNEAERLGPGLDELFGYLRRRGEQARDGAPGSSTLPANSRSLLNPFRRSVQIWLTVTEAW